MFSDVVICSYNMLTIIKIGCTHIPVNTIKNTETDVVFRGELWLI